MAYESQPTTTTTTSTTTTNAFSSSTMAQPGPSSTPNTKRIPYDIYHEIAKYVSCKDGSERAHLLALLRTCKALHAAVEPILYHSLDLAILSRTKSLASLQSTLSSTPRIAAYVKSLQYQWTDCYRYSGDISETIFKIVIACENAVHVSAVSACIPRGVDWAGALLWLPRLKTFKLYDDKDNCNGSRAPYSLPEVLLALTYCPALESIEFGHLYLREHDKAESESVLEEYVRLRRLRRLHLRVDRINANDIEYLTCLTLSLDNFSIEMTHQCFDSEMVDSLQFCLDTWRSSLKHLTILDGSSRQARSNLRQQQIDVSRLSQLKALRISSYSLRPDGMKDLKKLTRLAYETHEADTRSLVNLLRNESFLPSLLALYLGLDHDSEEIVEATKKRKVMLSITGCRGQELPGYHNTHASSND